VRLWLSEAAGCGNNAYRTNCIPLVSDVDLDGSPEIVAGRVIYAADGTIEHQDTSLPDGWNAVGNFDDDPYAEIVLVTNGFVRLLEHDLTVKWGPVDLLGTGAGGAPTVADFDGDGQPEIGVAGANYYVVFDTDGSTLWQAATVDGSSNRTGSTVFDFQNDGFAEVVYRDEQHLWIFRGNDGAVLFSTPVGSATTVEYPLVVDVDADGEAEIVAVSDAARPLPDGTTRQPGIYIFGSSPGRSWVRARPIWNQHTYHVTNILPDGTVPAHEQPNWLAPGMNHFRQNDFLEDEADRADSFTYRARDGALASNIATVFLDLRPPNTAPRIVSEPDRTATAGIAYLHAARAVDLDRDPILFALGEAPAGMTIDPTTGLLRWAPTAADLGEHTVALSVTDDEGFVGHQIYTLLVSEPVRVPDVVGMTQAAAGSALAGDSLVVGRVSQSTHPTIAAGLVAAQSPPAGAVAEPGSAVNLVASLGAGPEDVDDDGDGFSENQGDDDDNDPTVYPGAPDLPGDGIDQDGDGVDGSEPPVRIDVVPGASRMLEGETAALQAFGIFADGTAQNLTAVVAWSSTNGAVAGVSPAGVVTAAAAGTATIHAMRSGLTGSAAVQVVASTPSDQAAPGADITAPVEGATVLGPIDVVGTATDPNFVRYELAIAPADAAATDEGAFTMIGGGTSPIAGGVLGQLDPTLLLNDLYRLRLTVLDGGGNQTIDEVTVQIDGNQKVGSLTLSFTDLSIPMSGLPIEVTRSYDSRDHRQGDFGIGWRLGVETLEITCTSPLGEGWTVVKAGLSLGLVRTREQGCSLALPDGQVERFDLVPQPSTSVLIPFTFLTSKLVPRPGTLGNLEVLDYPSVLILDPQPGPVQLLDDTTFDVFDPQRFRYRRPDGSEIVFHRARGVESIKDANGNSLTLGPGGIVHSAGKSILFDRDTLGRITRVTDPAGNAQTYGYSAAGDLIAHSDSLGNTTRFFYNHSHDLLRIEDPLERPIIRNEYDHQGRLVAATSPSGRRVSFTYALGARTETITDVDGTTLVMEYDPAGNVSKVTNALGGVTTHVYDANGNRIATTDAEGATTTRTFDARNNLLSETDALGHVTTLTYDASSRLASMTDAKGRTSRFDYDSRGNLTRQVDPSGHARALSYDGNGNLVATSDRTGHVTRFEYDASGLRTAIIDAEGNRSEYVYDVNGDLVSTTDASGSTVTMTLDSRRLLTSINDEAGNSTAFGFSPRGELDTLTDPLGAVHRRETDAEGRDTRVIDPLAHATTRAYAPDGNLAKVIDASGRETTFTYDPLDRLVMTTLPDGSTVRAEYDLVGRASARIDARGNRTQFTHDVAGRLIATTDPVGSITRLAYDEMGNVTEQIDPLGQVTRYEYDELGRRTRIVFPDGTEESAGYDEEGRQTSRTDELGRTTLFSYDGVGNLIEVVDPGGGVTSYAYDAGGNLILRTDAEGSTTRFDYDANGRLVRTLLPTGFAETRSYDAAGRVLAVTNATGETVRFAYDANGQLAGKQLPDGSRVDLTYTPTHRLATASDHRGTTTYSYDALDRPLVIAKPEGSLTYSWDPAGNLKSITTTSADGSSRTIDYAWDPLDRLESVTSVAGTTRYTYDAASRRTRITRPNGILTDYVYDSRGRVTDIAEGTAGETLARLTYVRDPVGDITSVSELDGASSDFVYDSLRRLMRETHRDSVGGLIADLDYEYDAVGNRLTATDHRAGVTTTYDYDGANRLLSAGANTYGWDAAGRLTKRTDATGTTSYSWSAEDRLLGVAAPIGTYTFRYDAFGSRVGESGPGGDVDFLIDEENPTGLAQALEELTAASGVRLASYTYGDVLLSQQRGGNPGFYHFDAPGSVRLLSDAAGAVTNSYRYAAFGELLTTAGALPNGYLFKGERRQLDLDLDHFRARWYDPSVARFLSRDPFAGSLGTPATLHPYQYATSNPLAFSDPTGEFAQLIGALVAVGVAAEVISNTATAFVTGLAALGVADESKPGSQKIAEFAVSVIYGGAGSGLAFSVGAVLCGGAAAPLGGPAALGAGAVTCGALGQAFVAITNQLIIKHFVAREDISVNDLNATILLNGFGTVALSVGTLGFGGSAVASRNTEDIFKILGFALSWIPGVQAGSIEKFFKEGIVGGRGEVFWCKDPLLWFNQDCDFAPEP
jgi:RHS repeat-associated protein